MRLLAIFSLLLLIAALVLNVLLLLAGHTVGFLDDIDIVTLNTSNVGGTLVTSNTSPLEAAASNAVKGNPTASEVAAAASAVLKSVPSASAAAEALVASGANSLAQAVGLHDFYAFHVQNWCEGYYEPYAQASNATENVTSCSNSTALWNFNLTQIIQSELKVGYLASELNIPSDVNDGLTALQTAFKVMFIFYCITIGVTGVGILMGLVALAMDGRISACLNGIWTLIDALCSIVASGIATAIMYVAQNVLNNYQSEFGITATKGTKFLAMTWAATALIIVAFLVWSVDCCVGGKDRRSRGRYRRADKETY